MMRAVRTTWQYRLLALLLLFLWQAPQGLALGTLLQGAASCQTKCCKRSKAKCCAKDFTGQSTWKATSNCQQGCCGSAFTNGNAAPFALSANAPAGLIGFAPLSKARSGVDINPPGILFEQLQRPPPTQI
ncbi:hypothetical protein QQ054_27555 [Oscillatoria amoena NRMC-F 0135]|nr:hypothetical protein [Oscillatoria amoena NRMC-F 0135]